MTLLRKAKRNYFVELDNRILKGNRKFWKTVNIFRKSIPNESITTKKVSLRRKVCQANVSAHTKSFLKAIETFEYHPSILKIKEFTTEKRISFSFGYATQEKTYKTLQNLSKKKTCQENEIPVKI